MVIRVQLAPGEIPVSNSQFRIAVWSSYTGVAYFVSR